MQQNVDCKLFVERFIIITKLQKDRSIQEYEDVERPRGKANCV